MVKFCVHISPIFTWWVTYYDSLVVTYLPEKSPDDPSALLNQLIPQSYIDLEEAVQTKAAKMMIAKEIPILTEKEFL